MSSSYSKLAGLWYALPKSTRIFISRVPPLRLIKHGLIRITRGSASHDEVYGEHYYSERQSKAHRSAQIIAQSIFEQFAPSSAIDVGCGAGDLLFELGKLGVHVRGFEYSEAALRICHDRELDVEKFDLTAVEPRDNSNADLMISMEVAEHLPESCADEYVDFLTSADCVVVFAAATPGQGGRDHVNEQPHEYWITKFKDRGFAFDEIVSLAFRDDWQKKDVASWYSANLMIFRTDSVTD